MHLKTNTILLVVFIASPILMVASTINDSLICYDNQACHNNMTPSGVMINHLHAKNEWMFSYRYMNMNMKGMRVGLRTLDKKDVFASYMTAPKQMTMNMHMLMAMYGISNNITAMVMLNYQLNDMNMFMLNGANNNHNHAGSILSAKQNGSLHRMKTAGISDFEVHLMYGLMKEENKQLVTSLGVSIPIGNIQLKGNANDAMYTNQRYPYNMQLGSGTFDLLPGINYLYQQPHFSIGTQLHSTFRTGYNKLNYKWGNELTLMSWYSYQWLYFLSSSIRVEGNITEMIKGNDTQLYSSNDPAAYTYNYGGKKINGYIGSVLQFKKRCLKNNRLSIEYGIPFYENLNGMQMKTTHTLQLSWAISLN